jgi:hypothetical protein
MANNKKAVSAQTDADLIARIEGAIVRKARGRDRLSHEIPLLIRRSVDEVIDAPRTGRFRLSETEKTEKTYLGTKVEILLRNFLGFPKGQILDLVIDGIETDVKNTMSGNWMIPQEAIGHPCLLIKEDELTGLYSFGIIVAQVDSLTSGGNRDGKRSISSSGQERIHWIMKDASYPKNLWEEVDSKLLAKITRPTSGTERIDMLFRNLQGKPISRSMILAVARQKDSMKRLRKNGGARDSLAKDGIALLSGSYDSDTILALHLPKCEKDEFISFKPILQADKLLLRAAGKIK